MIIAILPWHSEKAMVLGITEGIACPIYFFNFFPTIFIGEEFNLIYYVNCNLHILDIAPIKNLSDFSVPSLSLLSDESKIN